MLVEVDLGHSHRVHHFLDFVFQVSRRVIRLELV
jgi:hypothetical protein